MKDPNIAKAGFNLTYGWIISAIMAVGPIVIYEVLPKIMYMIPGMISEYNPYCGGSPAKTA